MDMTPASSAPHDVEPPHPWLGKKVTFRYGHFDWGTGVLEYAKEFTGIAKVRDDLDGQLWFGLLDHVELDVDSKIVAAELSHD